MKIIGILLILNSLILCSYWMIGENTNKPWILTITLLAVFIGIFLIVSNRQTEVSIKGIGSIKSAADAAQADASEIAEIKKRVITQSATIDLVASKAIEAHALTLEAKRILDFSMLVQKALNDDRHAFNTLFSYLTPSSDLCIPTTNVIVSIRSNANGPIEPGFLNLPAENSINSLTDWKQLKNIYNSLPAPYRASAARLILAKEGSKKEKIDFCANVLNDDPSLYATNIAGKFLAKESGLPWEPYRVESLIEWAKSELKQ